MLCCIPGKRLGLKAIRLKYSPLIYELHLTAYQAVRCQISGQNERADQSNSATGKGGHVFEFHNTLAIETEWLLAANVDHLSLAKRNNTFRMKISTRASVKTVQWND